MQHSDRALVEELFLAGALRALCATSTRTLLIIHEFNELILTYFQ